MNKKNGFVSLETIVVATIIICLGVYALQIYQKVGENIVDSFIVTIDETINIDNIRDDNKEGNSSKWIRYNHKYLIGDTVLYKGKSYICIYIHVTNGDNNWAPDKASSLWKAKE